MAESEPTQVGIREFRNHLSLYIEKVGSGATVIVTQHGKQVARLVPPVVSTAMPWDALTGQVWIADDFDDDLPAEIIDAMNDGPV
jgi:prevent-host-death family protein